VLHYDKLYFMYLLFDLEDIIKFILLVDVFELKCNFSFINNNSVCGVI
jgi:hypothetical protein